MAKRSEDLTQSASFPNDYLFMKKKISIAALSLVVVVAACVTYSYQWIPIGRNTHATSSSDTAVSAAIDQNKVARSTEHTMPYSKPGQPQYSVPEESTDWIMYQNEEQQFSIKYPPDWSVKVEPISSTDKRVAASGPISGKEVVFSAPMPCNYIRCFADYLWKNLVIEIFPANAGDTTLTALQRIKGSDVMSLDIKPLIVDRAPFSYYNVFEYIIDATGSQFVEPAFVKNNRLYIIQCDTMSGAHMIFDDCNMTLTELQRLLSTFKFLK